jgi:hypothetical protein
MDTKQRSVTQNGFVFLIGGGLPGSAKLDPFDEADNSKKRGERERASRRQRH